ncbi:MAG: DUF4177 domain-containing protein [Anaerotignum sp.]|nr:DUF4177 domain-containing protein [Anaerotignum sp.]
MWEYKTETFESTFATKKTLKEKSDKVLEAAGKDGWELVNFQCVGASGTMMVFVFKRKIG